MESCELWSGQNNIVFLSYRKIFKRQREVLMITSDVNYWNYIVYVSMLFRRFIT